MGVSKVTLNGVTLMDVTDKTVDTDNLLAGNSALRNDGESITGAVVTASPSDASPAMDGTASAGVATTYSRGDHVHPSDTSKANINNPSFTGTPTAPTASKGTNTTQIATTEFVQSAITDINYPVTSVNTKTGAVVLTASDVGALPDSTTIPQGTVTSVRVQATSPVQSSTNTAQSTTLNTTISLADSYGDTKNPYAAKAKNTVLAGPSTGTATVPSFRTLEADDIPSLTVSKISDFPSTMTPSSHSHGYVSNDGKVLSQSAIGNGDRLVITDSSDSDKIATSSITFGTSTTTFLTNKGTWKTPNYPVTSVNTKTGAVSLTASDVGALPDTTEVPTATSDLTNDSGFITSSDIPVTSVNTKTGAVSLSASDVGALPDSTDVTKWNGVSLTKTSSNHYSGYVPYMSATDSTSATLQAFSSTRTSGKIAAWDSSGYLYSSTPTARDNSGKVATTEYVDSAISGLGSILNYKGTKATESALPSTGNKTGDVWIVSADNSEYVWNGTAWEKFGPTIDLSGYVPTSRTVNGKALSTDISLSASDVSALPDSTDVTKWNGVTLNKSTWEGLDTTYVPHAQTSSPDTAYFIRATWTPTAYVLAKYDASKYLHSNTPSASDNSTKVATTAFVKTAVDSISVPVTSVNSKTGDVVLTAADVGALPSSTDLSVYMQKGVDYVTAGQKSGTTLGERATAEGWYNTSSGYYSHTEGQQNSVSGNSSHAEGSNNTVTSDYAHAEGGNNTVSGNWAHAEGRYNTASGNHSHAEGNETTASGARSHAEGEYTTANHKSQHVFGEYNILDSSAAEATARGTYVEIVGNGTADNARSNARTLDWSGNEVLAGKLTVGTGPTNNMDVATKQYVDSKEVPPEIFWITVTQSDSTYTSDKTFTEIKAAHDDGKLCLMIDPSGGVDRIFRLHYVSSSELSFTRSGKTANGPFIQDMTMGTDNSWTLVTQYAQNRITASGLLKGDGSGGVTAAAASDIPSLDYVSKVTSSDNAVVRFNGTSGEVQNSGVTIDDNNVLLAPTMGTSTNTYIEFPDGGGFRTTGSTQTGYLKITLPQSWTDTMMSFKVQMYQYNQNTSCEFTIGGYNYSSGDGTWTNRPFAYSIGKSDVQTYSNLTVRLGHDGTKCAVYIGEANTSWQYMQIQVHDVLVGYKNYEYNKWATGWSVGFTTTLGTVTATITNPCVSYYAATAGTATSATSATSATTATTAGASKALNFVQTNELLLGNTNAQNRIWINYRRVENGATSGNTAITEYHFGNGNAGTTGVTLYAANFSGVAAKATAANVTTTANALAVYSDTTGTFSGKASANGALYATAANGALTFGTLPIAQGGTGKTSAADAWTALGGGASGKHADSYFALASHNHAAGDINSGTLGVARGGTGAASFTANCVIMSNTTTTGALTTRAVTNNTSATALAANTNIPTQNTVYYGLNHRLNRTTAVNAADTGYTTIMARGMGLRNADTNPSLNGAINWTYG